MNEKVQDWLWEHPLWRVGGGSEDGFCFFKVYGNRFSETKWFQRTVIPLYRLARALDQAKWELKWRLLPRHKYYLVNTGLQPGYYDEDTRMLHACMALLGVYVNGHGGPEKLAAFSADLRADPDQNAPQELLSGQADRQDEAVAIWRWWTLERPADETRRDALLHRLYGEPQPRTSQPDLEQEFRALEKKIDDDEQAMLHRLIDIRPALWS